MPNTDTKRHSVKEDRRQIGFQVPKTDTKRDSVKAGTRQLHTGGTAVRCASNIMYDDQTARLPKSYTFSSRSHLVVRSLRHTQFSSSQLCHGLHILSFR